MLPRRTPVPDEVAAQLLYEADHTCCICRNKKPDVQVHHIAGREKSVPNNLIVLCLNCHSEVERKGGLGRAYSDKELKHYKRAWSREVSMRRKHTLTIDRSLVLFEVRRLMYKFHALDSDSSAEPRALELMRMALQFARDFDNEVKQECVSFVYETSDWLRRGISSREFVSHQTSILLECAPIRAGGLVAPSRKPLGEPEVELLDHIVNVAGEVAYAVCKYIRDKKTAEVAIGQLHDLLRFAVLNCLAESERSVLDEFSQCKRISREPLNHGHPFEAGLDLLDIYKKEALAYRPEDRIARRTPGKTRH